MGLASLRAATDDEAMTTYSGTDEFEGASFTRVSLKGATLRSCDLTDVQVHGSDVGANAIFW